MIDKLYNNCKNHVIRITTIIDINLRNIIMLSQLDIPNSGFIVLHSDSKVQSFV